MLCILDNTFGEGSCYDLIFLSPVFVLVLLINCETVTSNEQVCVYTGKRTQLSTDFGLALKWILINEGQSAC